MCGIAGVIHKNSAISNRSLKKMTDAIAHRGPDGEGYYIYKNIGFGHRRLSIIDLDGGKQPLCNEDSMIWITYNGELYNYLELRRILKQKGHSFKTNSDTEVIVHSYEQWGKACVNKFRGMFAFAILDIPRQKIFLARDHMGIKPLVYYKDNNCFGFSSEIQALQTLDGIDKEFDIKGIDEYLKLQYIPAPRTVYKNIKKLPPAHRMEVDFEGNIIFIEKYWDLNFKPNRRKSEMHWLEELDSVLQDSVNRHLVADVPFGAFLSGGIDSTVIVGYMATELKMPVKTFSIGFEEEAFNELPYSQQVAQKYNTDHIGEIIKPDALDILPKLVKHYGEPFGDSSAIPTYYVSELARKHVPMVLSGDGGDECFLGYKLHALWHEFTHQNKPKLPYWKQKLNPYARALWPSRYPEINYPQNKLDNWYEFIQYHNTADRVTIWKDEYRETINEPNDFFESHFEKSLNYSALQRIQYMDLKTYLPFDILTKVDIASMAHGLEVRPPLVDVNVMEFIATMPESVNFRMNGQAEPEGKILLKKLLQKDFSKKFLYREKKGFAVPLTNWYNRSGQIRERLMDSNQLSQLFDKEGLNLIMEQNHARKTWLLLFLDEWLAQAK